MKKWLTFLMLFSISVFLLGCQREKTNAETFFASTVPLEVTKETSFVETQAEGLSETETLPAYQEKQAYQWMVNLKEEDVEFIEFVFLDDPLTPYRRYEGEEIQEILDLFQNNMCYDYASSAYWRGYYTQEFHIVMKDGTAHTVCSIETLTTVIDGAAFDTISPWIMSWPESGNAPLPKDWEQQVTSRNYNVVEEERSLLSTGAYQQEREKLDYQYGSSILVGADSRAYPIGRGGVRLYAEAPSATGVSIKAYWTGAHGGRQVLSKPEYWLERWEESTPKGQIGYHVMETDLQLRGTVQLLTPQEYVHWYIPWDQVYGSLQPGYYRIGMTFAERLNGMEQNETICYAKFHIE